MAGHPDDQYLDLLKRIVDEGATRASPSGAPARSVFGHQLRFDLARGFPLLTTRKLAMAPIVHGVLGALSADDRAAEDGASPQPDGAVAVPASAAGVDGQVRRTLHCLAETPDHPGLTVSGWPVAAADGPGTALLQVYVAEGALSVQLYQPSVKAFLDLPYAIAAGGLLTRLLAHAGGFETGEFVHTLGDAQVRESHMPRVREQLARRPYPPPRLRIDASVRDLTAMRPEHVELEGYKAHPVMRAPVNA